MPKNPKLIHPHGLRLGAQTLGAHQHTLFRHLDQNAFLNRNLDQNVPKNAYLGKNSQVSAASRFLPQIPELRPQNPTLILHPTESEVDLFICVSSIKRILLFQKKKQNLQYSHVFFNIKFTSTEPDFW